MAVKGSNGAGALDTRLLREEATSITDAVSRIVRVTDQVSQGAETQVRSLDDALQELAENGMVELERVNMDGVFMIAYVSRCR